MKGRRKALLLTALALCLCHPSPRVALLRRAAAGAVVALLRPRAAAALAPAPEEGTCVGCLGVMDDLLARCTGGLRELNGCVASQDDRPEVFEPPWQLPEPRAGQQVDLPRVSSQLKRAVLEAGGSILSQSEDQRYLRAEFLVDVPLLGQDADDVEWYFTPDDLIVQFRAERRSGRADFGTNRQRLEEIRQSLGWELVPVVRNRQRALFFGESGDVIVDDPLLLQGIARRKSLEIMEHLEGTWVGDGVGEYAPHLSKFPFEHTLIIEKAVPHNSRKLHWAYRSIAKHKETKEGLHMETGFLRFFPEAIDHGKLEMTCTSSNGLSEVNEGTYTQDSFDVWTRYNGITRAQHATRPFVTEVRRICEIRPQNEPMSMEYRVEMATERTAMQPHLLSRLRKLPAEQRQIVDGPVM